VLGSPSSFHYHPFQYIDFKEQAFIRKQAAQHTTECVPDCGAKFFMDFVFMRVSADNYKCPDKKTDCIVVSYNNHSAYLVILDSASHRVWTFLTSSKDPPLHILTAFMKRFDQNSGVIFTDQGSELARSDEFCALMLKKFKYVVKPMGFDSPSQNGGAEIYNGTLTVKVWTLLYSLGLPAKFWSAALLHAVYLHNQLVHSSTGRTPYEGWHGCKPDVTHLKTFGSRACVKMSGT
jgi:hypothetical protein